MVESRPGLTVVAHIPAGNEVVGLLEFKGQLIVALTGGVYQMVEGVLTPIPFQQPGQLPQD